MIKIDGGRCLHNVFPGQHFTFGGRMLSLNMLDSKTLDSFKMKNIFKAPTLQNYLDNLLNKRCEWSDIYLIARKVTLDTYTRVFHYKILNNILFLNQQLYKIGKSITDKCTYCLSSVENIQYLFCQFKIQTFFRSKILIPNLSIQRAFIGFVDNDSDNYIFINHLLLILELYVYSNRSINVLKINTFIQNIIFVENLERFSIDDNKHKAAFHAKKWSTVIPLLLHQ